MNPRPPRIIQRFQPGFSVVETLVAIVVIAVLFSLCLPGLSRVRAYGASAKCTGNMRQIGLAFHGYANDHNNNLPLGSGPPTWWLVIAEYAGVASPTNHNYLQAGFFQCPGDKEDRLPGVAESMQRSYGVNFVLFRSYGVNIPKPNMLRIAQPAKTLLLSETRTAKYGTGYFMPTAERLGDLPVNHGRTINLLYFDGHVEPIDRDKLKNMSLDELTTLFYAQKPMDPERPFPAW